MTLTQAFHEFFAHLTYGYDKGCTQIWVTPNIYRSLVLEAPGVKLQPRSMGMSTMTVESMLEGDWEWPPFIELEGRRIFCAKD